MAGNLLSSVLMAVSLALSWSCLGATPSPSDWPQWRGALRDGQCNGPVWPAKIDESHLKAIWRAELGPSYSGPIVVGDRVFTTETRDRRSEAVMAYDRNTGKELWRSEWEGAMSVPFFARSNGDWIRSTPACDGESLFVAGMRDVLVCLDVASGRERWRVDFVEKFKTPLPDFGFVCSPLIDGDAVYVQAGASAVKLDKKTGAVRWRSLADAGGMSGSAFSSPIIATLAGRRQLVVQTREKLAGLTLDKGGLLWSQPVPAFRGMNILTPVAHKDMLYTTSYGGRSLGFKIGKSAEDAFSVTEAWTQKSQGYMTTPVIIDGTAYNLLKSQRVMAIDVETGAEHWTSDKSYGRYWSLIAQGDRILALDQRGILFLLHADKEKLDILAERKLTGAQTWAHLAVSGNLVLVRELNALAAYRWKTPGK